MYYVKEQTPVSITKEIKLKQYFSQVHTISSTNESFTLTLPNGGRNVTHLLACFLQTQRGTIKKSSTDFSSGYSNAYPEVKIITDATTNLKMIRFTLDKSYPNPDYDMNFNSVRSDNCGDLARSFYDMINNSNNRFDRSGNVVGIQEYSNEPFWCFQVNTDATTYNETLMVNVSLEPGDNGVTNGCKPSSSQLLVVALYDETLRLTFDTEKIVSTELLSQKYFLL